uniref:N-acetyl-lysine deacetylase n=1 Tax=uncultured bacterium esnapd17 TaxID=1366598 RepID=S5TLH8_9BACT|nr:N-acetyl-lysine deacetylase [uncultured bacterium esnapd17]
MTEDYPTWLLRAMLSVPSVSGQEARVASFVADQMGRLGMRAHVDAVGNAIGEIGPADGPLILLLGHLDTVPGLLSVCQIGELLYGRGAVDAKGPLAAMICAAATAGVDARVVVCGAVGEEVPGSRGTRHLLETLPEPAAVIIGEPSGWDGVCLGYKGRVGLAYEVTRAPMHTSSPEETAVEAATAFWRAVDGYIRDTYGGGVAFDSAAATLTDLTGDLRQARALITCRVPVGFDFDAFDAFVTQAAVQAQVTVDERVPAVRSPMDDPTARALRVAIRAHGAKPVVKVKAGTADMNVVASRYAVPIVAYGPGDAHLDHTDDEHLHLPELYKAISVLRQALQTLPGLLRTDKSATDKSATDKAAIDKAAIDKAATGGKARTREAGTSVAGAR